MKKLILPLFILGFIFASCENEDFNTQVEIDAIAAKAKINNEKSEEESCSEDGKCETAFGRFCECASLNTCFSDLGFNRWGWSVHLANPVTDKKFNLYAGAGQCDWENKGTKVGYVNVTFSANGDVTYSAPVIYSGYTLKEFHFYAGDTEVPIGKNGKSTVAPGQFYNEGDNDETPGVYVILHAVVCGDFEE